MRSRELTFAFVMVAVLSVVLSLSGTDEAAASRKAVATRSDCDDSVTRDKLGLSVRPLTPEVASRLGYHEGGGVLVDAVVPGGPADGTRIRPGDLIQKLNGEPVRTVEDFSRAAAALERGHTGAVLVRRGPSTFHQAIEIPA